MGENKVSISGRDVGHYLVCAHLRLTKPSADTGRLTPEQRVYNYLMSSARSVVEMAFQEIERNMEMPSKQKCLNWESAINITELLCTTQHL